MSERKSLSKKTRFDVFKRDGFVCQYCGKRPPNTVLEVDHIKPVCEGGKDHQDNLITACFDCNRGKGGQPLSVIPQTLEQKIALVAEKTEQLKALDRFTKAIARRQEVAIDQVETAFQDMFDGRTFKPSFRSSVRQFLGHFTSGELAAFMHTACSKRRDDPEAALKYFCGICWGTIRERERG
jgi:hypothetical protein